MLKPKLKINKYRQTSKIERIIKIRIFGIVTVIVPVGCFIYCLWSYSLVSPGADVNEINEYNKTALQITLDTANSLANLTVGLASGI